MMLRTLFLLCFVFTGFSGYSQTKNIKVYLDTKQFYAPGEGNYVEVNLQFAGLTVDYKPVTGGIQAAVAIEMEIFSENKSVQKRAYLLQSPIVKDSIVDDFYEVQRFALAPGSYSMHLKLMDANRPKSIVEADIPLKINELSNTVSLSDIQIAEYAYPSTTESPFNKSGYFMIPMISNYFPQSFTKMPVYTEIYNTNILSDTVVGVMYKILNSTKNFELDAFGSFQKKKTDAVIPIFKTIDISNLPTGTYTLQISVTNKNFDILSTKEFDFERVNDISTFVDADKIILDPAFQTSIPEDSVGFYLASLIPIARPAEIKNILASLKTKNAEKCRRHIQAFWTVTAPAQPYDEWIQYKKLVLYVEEIYGNNFQEGFETDRGRIYLKYGPPSTLIARESSASEYPYEIWTYNKIGRFSNRRFIFYNPDLVNKTYRLLHSDMLGETKNPGWQQVLSTRNTNRGDVDNPNRNLQPTTGNNSFDYFRNY